MKNGKIEPKSYDCPRCGLVTFQCGLRPVFEDGVEEPRHYAFDEVEDYGQCEVAKAAGWRPRFVEIQACPFYQELTGL